MNTETNLVEPHLTPRLAPDLPSKAELEAAAANGACLGRTTFRGASYPDALLPNIDFRNADLTGIDLSGAYLSGACFRQARMQGANLKGAVLQNTGMREVDLSGADLSDSDLRNAGLQDARLDGALFTGARIDGAQFAGALTEEVILAGARVADATLVGQRPLIRVGAIGPDYTEIVGYLTDKGIVVLMGAEAMSLSDARIRAQSCTDPRHARQYEAAFNMIVAHAEIWAA